MHIIRRNTIILSKIYAAKMNVICKLDVNHKYNQAEAWK